jgi:hypothetical protein
MFFFPLSPIILLSDLPIRSTSGCHMKQGLLTLQGYFSSSGRFLVRSVLLILVVFGVVFFVLVCLRSVLSFQCCLCFWMFHSSLSRRVSLTFIVQLSLNSVHALLRTMFSLVRYIDLMPLAITYVTISQCACEANKCGSMFFDNRNVPATQIPC